jgi:hypothetical protein
MCCKNLSVQFGSVHILIFICVDSFREFLKYQCLPLHFL